LRLAILRGMNVRTYKKIPIAKGNTVYRRLITSDFNESLQENRKLLNLDTKVKYLKHFSKLALIHPEENAEVEDSLNDLQKEVFDEHKIMN
jgi:argininosuccinate lyase